VNPQEMQIRGLCNLSEVVTRASSLQGHRKHCCHETKALQLNKAAARRISDSFGPANDIHLGEDAFHVRFHRAFTDKER
jgi:hypothetical protein